MQKFLWLDMEMTGLDVTKEVIIEVGAIVTGTNLEPLSTYHSVVKQDQAYLDRMDEWNTKQHGQSGLTLAVPNGSPQEDVEKALVALCDEHFKGEKVILAGNSIGQDRLFVDKYMPKFAERLHYRMLDVSSFKIVFNYFYQISYSKKPSLHRALDDIQESINELKKYLSYIKLD